MTTEVSPVSYEELGDIADALFEESDDDPAALTRLIDRLDPAVRAELLISDFLNAYQVFWYYFREEPEELLRDRMILEPASSLLQGIRIHENDLYEIFFRLDDHNAVMSVSDGEMVIVNYHGPDAYRRAIRYLDENT